FIFFHFLYRFCLLYSQRGSHHFQSSRTLSVILPFSHINLRMASSCCKFSSRSLSFQSDKCSNRHSELHACNCRVSSCSGTLEKHRSLGPACSAFDEPGPTTLRPMATFGSPPPSDVLHLFAVSATDLAPPNYSS